MKLFLSVISFFGRSNQSLFIILWMICFSTFSDSRNFVETHGFIHTKGTDLVDEKGEIVQFQGVSLGNWLLPEAYMLQFGKLADRPRKMESLMASIVGSNANNAFWKKYRDQYITEEDICMISSLGFNSVRPALNARLLLDENSQEIIFCEEEFKRIDQLVRWCRKYGLYVFLDLHGAPGGQTGANIDDAVEDFPNLFVSEIYKTKTISLWRELARRFASEPAVAAYDLLNEPLPSKFSRYNGELMPLYRRISQGIREIDKKHAICIEGANFASDWSALGEPFDDNLIYQFHKYWSDTSTDGIKIYTDLGKKWNVPIWVGETGENSTDWYWSAVQLLEANRVGWSFWPWKKIGGSIVCIQPPPGWEKWVKVTKGGNPPPAQEGSAILMAMTEQVQLSRCTTNLEVLRCLLRQVPGKIQAEHYGHRGSGTSYSLNRSLIPRTNYSIGMMDAGEWLSYPVVVSNDSILDFYVRLSCPSDGKSFQIQLDGSNISGEKTATKTSGWQSFESTTIRSIQITKGNHQLKFYSTTGGYNFDKILFAHENQFPSALESDRSDYHLGMSILLPGIIEAEHYGTEGEGVSYHDTDFINKQGKYRNDGVDIERCFEPHSKTTPYRRSDPVSVEVNSNDFVVSYIEPGEWIKYHFDCPKGGVFDAHVLLSSPTGAGKFEICIEDMNQAYQSAPSVTGSWDQYHPTRISNIHISPGAHTLIFKCIAGGYNFDAIAFLPCGESENGKKNLVGGLVPGILEAENFVKGGEGFGYHDTDSNNRGQSFRNEGVDISPKDPGLCVRLEAGEWTAYEYNAISNGQLTLTMLGGSKQTTPSEIEIESAGKSGRFFLDPFRQINLGSWFVQKGSNQLRLKCLQGSVAVDWFDFR